MSAVAADKHVSTMKPAPPLPADGKTLLLVASVPGDRTVGQILLREMLGCLDPACYVLAALLDSDEKEARGSVDACASRRFPRPPGSRRRFGGRLGGLLAAVDHSRNYEPAIARLGDDVAAFARESGVRRVWAIFNMPSVVDVCTRLLERVPMPLLAQVWDDIDHLTKQRRLDAFTRARTERRFGRLLARAERTAVICDAMGDHYARRFGARCQVVRHGVSDSTEPRGNPTSGGEFVIGFSGGMYSPSAWKCLLAALTLLGWQVANKPIRFVVMSGHVSFAVRSPALVEYLGWRPDAEVHARLAECDLLYLPQPFEAAQRSLAEFSFPTKLSAYVSTGRPVLVHAPAHGSLVAFARAHPLGILCTSIDPREIADAIDALASDSSAYQRAAHSVAAVANSILSRANFARQVRSFVA